MWRGAFLGRATKLLWSICQCPPLDKCHVWNISGGSCYTAMATGRSQKTAQSLTLPHLGQRWSSPLFFCLLVCKVTHQEQENKRFIWTLFLSEHKNVSWMFSNSAALRFFNHLLLFIIFWKKKKMFVCKTRHFGIYRCSFKNHGKAGIFFCRHFSEGILCAENLLSPPWYQWLPSL